MRPSFLFRSVAALACWWGSVLVANASHVLGADLAYEYAGTTSNPFQYHVTARLFRDGNSLITDFQGTLTCSKNECGTALPGSFTATLVRTGAVTVLPNCTGPGVTYQLITLEGMVQLPPGRWTLGIDFSNRAMGILNVVQSSNFSTYVKAQLDNSTGLTNSSPRFVTSRLIQWAGVQPQRFSVNTFDSEGDSLVYRLVQPLATPTAASPCGVLTTGPIAPNFQLNAATGELSTVPVVGPIPTGSYALAVQVDEYRRLNGSWQQIGSVARDVTYFLVASTNQAPAFTRVASGQNPTGQLLGQTIRVNPGQTVQLLLTATDADAGQVVGLASDLAAVVPGATLQDQGSGRGLFTWQVPAALPLGRYAFAVTAYDDACPYRGEAVLTLSFLVTRNALAAQPRQPLRQSPFPVPFAEEVRFQLATSGTTPVVVTDALGRAVAQLTSAPDGLVRWHPAASLPPGLYFARTLVGAQVARLLYSGR